VILTGGHCIIPVLLMLDDGADRFYDKAERDRQHALRRIRLRRARFFLSWAMLPWLIVAAAVSVILCLHWAF
jgi:hypothetical protein